MINRSSRPIATLFGIPLHLHWSAMLTALVIAVSAPAAVGITDAGLGAVLAIGSLAALLFGVSLLVHEYAHAIVARRRGIPVRRVSVWALGGLAELETEPRRWQDELAVSIVGPLASIALGVVALGGAIGFGVWDATVASRLFAWVAVLNIGLGVFNLLPGFPLDGGRVLHALMWWRSGDRHRATAFTAGSGRVIGGLLIALGVWSVATGTGGLLTALIGWFIMSSAGRARIEANEARRLGGLRAGDVAHPVPMAVRGDLSVADFLHYWLPANPSSDVVLTTDADQRATGIVPLAALATVPPMHAAAVQLEAFAIPARSLAVVRPDTDLGDAYADSASGFILVSEPDRLVGIITPLDLRDPRPRPTAGTGVGV